MDRAVLTKSNIPRPDARKGTGFVGFWKSWPFRVLQGIRGPCKSVQRSNAYAPGQSAAAAPAIPAGAWTPRLSGWSDEETVGTHETGFVAGVT